MKSLPFLLNHYLLKSELSDKGGRRTFIAQDTHSKEPVVIKVLQFGVAFEWATLKLFEREAEILKTINHPAIPKYKDYFEIEIEGVHSFVFVQAHIEAISLESAIRAGRTFSKAEILDIAERLLAILKYLHEQTPPIVHRDIKPSNILIAEAATCREEETLFPLAKVEQPKRHFSELYLIDFGSVHTTVSQETGTITIVGSYGYIPLEQFAGQAVPASDLYSLGMTIIYLVTGIHPADMPQIHGHVQLSRSQFSPKLARWLARLTHPYLDQRFDSADAALKELKAEESLAGYYQHLKPIDNHVEVCRDRDCLTLCFNRLDGLFSENVTKNFPFYSRLTVCSMGVVPILLGFVLTAPNPAFLVCASYLMWLLCAWAITWSTESKSLRRTARYRNIITINREQGIRSGIYDDRLDSTEWKEAARPFENITHIAYNPGYTFDHYYHGGIRFRPNGGAVTVLPKLSICLGSKKYDIRDERITQAEFWWLGKELSDFVGQELRTVYPSPEVPAADTSGGCGC